MKAAVFYEAKKPLKVEEYPTPKPVPNEILVKVAGCGICHTDIGYIDHGVPTFKKPPLILGHEASGTVAEIGSNVKRFKVGDRVLMGNVFECGECYNCKTGRSNVCENMVMLGNHMDGAFAEYTVVPEKGAFHLPEELPLVESSIIADAISTPYHAVVNRAQVKPGDQVVIVGIGGVGINCVQIAAAVGALVTAVDIVDMKLEMAKKLGAVVTINSSKEEKVVRKIREITGGGADVAMECTGIPQTIALAYDSIKPGGKVVIVGYPAEPVTLSLARLMFREQDMIGSLGCRNADFPKLINFVKLGKIKLESVVSHKFPLDKINEGLDTLRKQQTLRTVVEI